MPNGMPSGRIAAGIARPHTANVVRKRKRRVWNKPMVNLNDVTNVHFIGIAGAGMRAIANVTKKDIMYPV